MLGYDRASAESERQFEVSLQSVIDTAKARSLSKLLASETHVAGTRRQRWVVRYIDSLSRSYGLSSRIDSFLVYLPHPISVSVSRVAPDPRGLSVDEPPLGTDSTSRETPFPTFNAYTGDGDITGRVLYVNYGLADDYRALDSAGVSAAGAIAVARYGRGYRGLKAYEAERHGAKALILYSDPADDGFVVGDVYPEGPYRPARGVQRGTVKLANGDPSTPGWASTYGAPRRAENEMAGIPRIPVVPVGHQAAAELLAGLQGRPLPRQSWQGGLPFRYHVGPGPVLARVEVRTERGAAAMHAIYNTVATLPGTTYPNEWVVIGGHNDAWTPGAFDNVNGTVSVLEMTRAFARMAQQGYRPKRTLVFVTWDGEEWGQIGSIEWVEQHASELSSKVVAYINQDSPAWGPRFNAKAAGALKRLVRDVMGDVPNPFGPGSMRDYWQTQRSMGPDEQLRVFDVGGFGSDDEPFYVHLGIPALEVQLVGAGGMYHSRYDTYDWMVRFGDPEFRAHAGIARAAGTLAARIANAIVLPYDYAELARTLRAGVETLTRDYAAPRESTVPLRIAISELEQAAQRFERVRNDWLASGRRGDWSAVNRRLIEAERAFARDSASAGGSWYRHVLAGSDRSTWYEGILMPGLARALEDRDAGNVRVEIADIAKRLRRAAGRLDAARKILVGGRA